MSSSIQCLVSVVGYSAHGNTFSNSTDGVGKSCLCSRFLYDGADEYVRDHPSLLALHEFESQVIGTEPMIYWGSKMLECEGKNSSLVVQFQVLEHTLFYHDETSQLFTSIRSLSNPEHYIKKAAGSPDSSRKISFFSRDTIGFPDRYNCIPYPTNANRIPRGYILVVDVSRHGGAFEQQMSAMRTMSKHLNSSVTVVAATKRDKAHPDSLTKLISWTSKHKLTVIETSAEENINVTDAFRLVASRVFQKKHKISDIVLSYSDASRRLLFEQTQARSEFKAYLERKVKVSSVGLTNVEVSLEYLQCVKMHGKFATDELFALRVFKVRKNEVEKYPEAEGDPEYVYDLLEAFINEREDLLIYGRTLKALIITDSDSSGCSSTLTSPSHTSIATQNFQSMDTIEGNVIMETDGVSEPHDDEETDISELCYDNPDHKTHPSPHKYVAMIYVPPESILDDTPDYDDARTLGSAVQTPIAVTQTPADIIQTPASIVQAPAGISQTPDSIVQTPANIDQAPTVVPQDPEAGIEKLSVKEKSRLLQMQLAGEQKETTKKNDPTSAPPTSKEINSSPIRTSIEMELAPPTKTKPSLKPKPIRNQVTASANTVPPSTEANTSEPQTRAMPSPHTPRPQTNVATPPIQRKSKVPLSILRAESDTSPHRTNVSIPKAETNVLQAQTNTSIPPNTLPKPQAQTSTSTSGVTSGKSNTPPFPHRLKADQSVFPKGRDIRRPYEDTKPMSSPTMKKRHSLENTHESIVSALSIDLPKAAGERRIDVLRKVVELRKQSNFSSPYPTPNSAPTSSFLAKDFEISPPCPPEDTILLVPSRRKGSSPARVSASPPPVPPHTEKMFLPSSSPISPPTSPPDTTMSKSPPAKPTKKTKKQNYLNMNLFKNKKKERLPKSTSLEDKLVETKPRLSNPEVRPPAFLNMKERPLPLEPIHKEPIFDDHYEKPDENRPPMPLPGSTTSSFSREVSPLFSQLSPDHARPQAKPWHNPHLIGHQNAGSAQQRKPKRSKSVNYPHAIVYDDDNTDADGYEITDSWISKPVNRSPSQHSRLPPPLLPSRSIEYDYPVVGRSILPDFRSLPPRNISRPIPNPKTFSPTHSSSYYVDASSRAPMAKRNSLDEDDDDDDEYVNYQPQGYENFVSALDDPVYQNTSTAKASADDDADKPLKRASSLDDIHIYYNMRDRYKLLAQRGQKIPLPPRQMADDAPPPIAIPPKSSLIKQRIKESKVNIERIETMEKYALGNTSDDEDEEEKEDKNENEDTDEETGQKRSSEEPVEVVKSQPSPQKKSPSPQKRPVLPPRDVIRPGWADAGNAPNHKPGYYLPIIN